MTFCGKINQLNADGTGIASQGRAAPSGFIYTLDLSGFLSTFPDAKHISKLDIFLHDISMDDCIN